MLGHAYAKKIKDLLVNWKIEPLFVMPLALVILIFVANSFDPNSVSAVLAMLVALSPVWMPLYLLVFFWISWIDYIRLMFWFSQSAVLLEVQLPQTIDKNPNAFETFLATFHNASGETTFLARMWKGSFRPIWAIEIASNEGRLGFYIHTRRAFQNIVEARFYGQFPEAKLVEVDDYAARVPFNLDEYDIFGAEYQKGTPEALPIKTYVDWGLDKDPKEELKIDPITNILELLGQVGKNEYYWMQLILKTRRDETEWYGFRRKPDPYKEAAYKEIQTIVANAAKRSAEVLKLVNANIDKARLDQAQEQAASRGLATLTEGERRRVDKIERNLSKLTWEVGIRIIYMARKENFNGINNGAIVRFFDTFKGQDAAREYNSLNVTRGTTFFDYPWQDIGHVRLNIMKESLYFHYKNRAYFYVPYDQKPAFLTSEEIATLWHIPSAVVQTPGLNRVPSRRAEAPVNLPV
jgi:hypothetical protein